MKPKFTNRLANETSPYLLQHAHNPVDWYPWGEEALKRARREEKPIFLSIGYSACHWCHVMEHESFESEETAKLMNEHFVNIKVDREERPDLDQIYMNAVQVMTQHGGWPMSVFLTPELEPFYGGTYFPDEDRGGMPAFKKILMGVANAWKTRREEVRKSARELVGALDEISRAVIPEGANAPLDKKLVADAVTALGRAFDPRHGGFGSAPKFFHSMGVQLCLRQWKATGDKTALGIATVTLDHWLRGGIYDQLGGGFHRYSTDPEWLVPHFEKMLYDNALLSTTFLEAFQATRNPEYARVARETLDYTLRELTATAGGFFGTQDADSEGVEGKFYVWTRDEVRKLLDPELADQFSYVYDVTAEGNWHEAHAPGAPAHGPRNILRRVKEIDEAAAHFKIDRQWLEDNLATARRKLLTARGERVWPQRDEKILVAWNGLMIEAMARGHQVLGDERYLAAARDAATFILDKMTTHERGKGPRLLHAHKDGRSRFSGCLDDYANFVSGLVALYESDFDLKWIRAAIDLADVLIDQFWDNVVPGFFYTGTDHEKLITRVKDTHDGATPSGTAMAVTALARLGKLTGRTDYLKKAEAVLTANEALLRTMPTATCQSLIALDFLHNRPREIAIVSPPGESAREETESALQTVRERFLPNKVVALLADGESRAEAEKLVPLFASRPPVGGHTTVYVCESATCRAPVTRADELAAALDA